MNTIWKNLRAAGCGKFALFASVAILGGIAFGMSIAPTTARAAIVDPCARLGGCSSTGGGQSNPQGELEYADRLVRGKTFCQRDSSNPKVFQSVFFDYDGRYYTFDSLAGHPGPGHACVKLSWRANAYGEIEIDRYDQCKGAYTRKIATGEITPSDFFISNELYTEEDCAN